MHCIKCSVKWSQWSKHTEENIYNIHKHCLALHMKKLKFKGDKWCTQGYLVSCWPYLNLGCLLTKTSVGFTQRSLRTASLYRSQGCWENFKQSSEIIRLLLFSVFLSLPPSIYTLTTPLVTLPSQGLDFLYTISNAHCFTSFYSVRMPWPTKKTSLGWILWSACFTGRFMDKTEIQTYL